MVPSSLILVLSLFVESEPHSSDIERGLRSPYFEVRSEAQTKLSELSFEEGQALARGFLSSAERRLRIAALEWYIAQLRLGREKQLELADFVAQYVSETDPAVRMRFFHAAAEIDGAIVELSAARKEGRFPADELDRLIDARLIRLTELTMVEGSIPGFFDGQFAALHTVDELAYIRICRMAWDPRLHFVLRALMIMSLAEKRPKEMERLLTPLLLEPRVEVEVQHDTKWNFRLTAFDVRNDIVAKLSQYARFSLAKAGIAGPIEVKIDQLSRMVRDYLAKDAAGLGRRFATNGPNEASFALEEAMDFQFEAGYHHQQLDRYDKAEAAYRVIIDRPEHLRAKRWAHYNLACIRALTGRNDEAIAELEKALAAGFSDMRWAARDGDLKTIRDDPRFQAMLRANRPAGK